MSVLIEGINLVLRRARVEANYPGGLVGLAEAVTDAALCIDSHLVRLGFLDGDRVDGLIEHLEASGLTLTDGERFLDFAVVDQVNGLPLPCDWLEFDSAPGEPAYCWMSGEPRGALVVPTNWRYEHSLSRRFGRIGAEPSPERYRRIGTEAGVDVYEDLETGQRVHFARAGDSGCENTP